MNRESTSLLKLTDNEEDNHERKHDGVGLVEWVLFYAPPEQGEGDYEAQVQAEHCKNLEDESQHIISKRRIIIKRWNFTYCLSVIEQEVIPVLELKQLLFRRREDLLPTGYSQLDIYFANLNELIISLTYEDAFMYCLTFCA